MTQKGRIIAFWGLVWPTGNLLGGYVGRKQCNKQRKLTAATEEGR